MTTRGIDLSEYQATTPSLAGLGFVIVRASIGYRQDARLHQHAPAALDAGLALGLYHALLDHNPPNSSDTHPPIVFDGAQQARTFAQITRDFPDAELLPGVPRFWVDVEADGVAAGMLMLFLQMWGQLRPNAPIGIYTSAYEWKRLIGLARREFAVFPLWDADYSGPLDLPDIWDRAVIRQTTGTGHQAGYPGNLDLDELETPVPTVPPVTTAPGAASGVTHGPRLGLHSINPGNTLALVQRAMDSGWHWPLVKVCNDAEVCVGVKRISPLTITECRYVTDDGDQNLQGVEGWMPVEMSTWAARRMALLLGRTTPAQLRDTDYWGLTNEPDPPGVAGHRALGLALCELVKLATARGVKLTLPAYPQGVPEYDEMQALRATGLFKLMVAGGHVWDVHEGVFENEAIDKGWGSGIPGAPHVDGAGSACFRYRYLYSMLAADERPGLLVSEAYLGGGYPSKQSNADILTRLAWYDRESRKDDYLISFTLFTINPNDDWRSKGVDYGPTFSSRELWDYIAAEKDLLNGDPMANIPDEQVVMWAQELDSAQIIINALRAELVKFLPPAPAQPLYMATVLIGVIIRDTAGADTGRRLTAGTQVAVYAENVTAGGYTNRVRINQNGDSVTTVDNTGRPTLQRQ